MTSQPHNNWIAVLATAENKHDVRKALAMIADPTKIEEEMLHPENNRLIKVHFRKLYDVVDQHRNRSNSYTSGDPHFESKCNAVLNGLLSHWKRESNPTVKNMDHEALHLKHYVLRRKHEKSIFNSQLKKVVIVIPDLIRVNVCAVSPVELNAYCRNQIDDTTQALLRREHKDLDKLFSMVAEMRYNSPQPTTDLALRKYNALTGILEAIIDLKAAEKLGIRVSELREGLAVNQPTIVKAREQEHDQLIMSFQHRVLSTDNHSIRRLCVTYQNRLNEESRHDPANAMQLQPKINALSEMIAVLSENGDSALRNRQFKDKLRQRQHLFTTRADKTFLKMVRDLVPTQSAAMLFGSQQTSPPPATKPRHNGRLFDRTAAPDDSMQLGGSKARRYTGKPNKP